MSTKQTTLQQDLGSLAADLVTAGNHEGAALVTAAVNAMAAPQQPVAASSEPVSYRTDWPEFCPITRLPFFMEIDGVPTYGGPFDSYTIPTMEGEPTDLWHDRELSRRHYDHDRGHWVDDESISMRVISEDALFELQEAAEKASTNQPIQAKALTDEPAICEDCDGQDGHTGGRHEDDYGKKCDNCDGSGIAVKASAPPIEQHYDDYAVDCFATMMKEKLAKKRAEGRGGWEDPEQCSVKYLSSLLHEHVKKGDPVDVANLCMMIRHYDAPIAPQPFPTASDVRDVWYALKLNHSWMMNHGPAAYRAKKSDLYGINVKAIAALGSSPALQAAPADVAAVRDAALRFVDVSVAMRRKFSNELSGRELDDFHAAHSLLARALMSAAPTAQPQADGVES